MNKIYKIKKTDFILILSALLIDIIFIILIAYFSITQFEWFYALLLPLMIWAIGSNFIGKIQLISQIKKCNYNIIKIKNLDSGFGLEISDNSNKTVVIDFKNIQKISIDEYGILGYMNFFRGKGSNIGYQNSIIKLGIINIQTNDWNNYKLTIANINDFEQHLLSMNINVNIEKIETL